MRTFFFLTDLPDTFTEDFSIEQIVRYGSIIDMVKKCAQLELDQERIIKLNDSSCTSMASNIDKLKNIYQKNLIGIKKMLIQFISDMDIHEVYSFVNLFPFLVDQEALRVIIENEEQENMKYSITIDDSELFPFEDSSSSSSQDLSIGDKKVRDFDPSS